ncbi:ferrichrome receptor FiuA [Gluconacetobacter liquefaciens]|uniref:Iron complex outermembrane receptor protein n=1 Tax=Gluconacetobacter liquefaciens TaxID=89584 RepID=A0A370G040_GLULI|nr:TonB-dependent siderophore receptor [Gluconacetobacter liquefaciens]MBB2187915.1 TonB-dependent siderophore receptor [Gluconacetobacter liquefaciens]RDI34201.1 iron complex outermembrane receptor protein [Gluconacetobacter liquefaciens]GEB38838.1 ferrichrome receptor FiuA [Gluconacetobacter liquefaciens]
MDRKTARGFKRRGYNNTLLFRLLMSGSALACGALALCPAIALAQTAGITAGQQKLSVNIPAGDLNSSLLALSQAAHLQIFYDMGKVKGLKAHAVSGTMTADQALATILNGSGYSFSRSAGNRVSLVKTSASTIVLGPVKVGGHVSEPNAQAPYGPGEGFVATRSLSATKTDSPILTTPKSIYVITRQQMDDLQPLTIDEALRYAPGISDPIGGSGTPMNNSHDIYQRGFQSDTFVDGLMTGVSPSVVEPFMLDRLEALSGPASVMYGQAAPGGIINVSLKRPTEKAQNQVNIGFGSYGRYEGQFDSSGPLTKDGSLLYRIVAIGNTQGDQTQYKKYERLAIQPALTWKIDRKTELTFIGQYNYTPALMSNAGGPAMGAIFPQKYLKYSPYTFTSDPAFQNSHQNSGFFEYIFSHIFNSHLKFSQNFRYEHVDSYFAQLFSQGLVAGTSNMRRYALVNSDQGYSVLLDNHLQGDFSTGPVKHTVLIGVDYRLQKDVNRYAFDFSTVPTLNLLSPRYHQYTYADFIKGSGNEWDADHNYLEQEGIYFQDQFQWKGLNIMLGGREDWNNWYDQFQRAFTWHAGASYELPFGLAPYFSYATSFNPQSGDIYGAGQASPLVGKQWEVGLKYQPRHSQMLFTAAAYDLRENNVLINDPDHQNFDLQVGQIRVRGVDLSANANLAQGLNLSATYSYMEPQNSRTNLTTTTYTGETVSMKDKAPSQLPRHTVSLFVDYKFPRDIAPGLSINAGLRYVGSTYGDNANSFKVPAYTVFDGGATYDFGALMHSLKGLNMRVSLINAFDKQYVVSCSSGSSCAWGQLRRVYGSVGYRW